MKTTAMNTMSTTEDTREDVTVPALPADDRTGDGYDWMATLHGTPWAALPGWGEDGWDCGAWPLIIIIVAAATDEKGRLYGLGTYVEGDTSARWFRSREAQHRAITAEAFFHWKNGQADGPADLPEHVADLDPKFCAPYLPD